MLARPGIQLHQEAVGRLMQAIKRKPPAGEGDRWLILSAGAMTARQLLQCAGELAAESLSLQILPIFEGIAVAQAKPGQKVILVQGDRLSQRFEAAWAGLASRVVMHAA